MKYFLIGILLIPRGLGAQTTYQKTADVISWVSVISALSVDTYTSFHCSDKKICLIRQGIKDGSIIGVSEIIKRNFKSARPCSIKNECGFDNLMMNMPSEHTALAFGSINERHLAIQFPLAIVTGIGRRQANKHTVGAILVGAFLGSGIDFAVSKIK